MTDFEKLYYGKLNLAVNGKDLAQNGDELCVDQLDCLLNPKKYPVVLRTEDCSCSMEERKECSRRCLFDAILPDGKGGIGIDKNKCIGCGVCVDSCKAQKLVTSKDAVATLSAMKDHTGLTYALVAPAFLGQFSSEVTPGKLRSAIKAAGFDGMIEVALFADMLTLKEALEFDRMIKTEKDYQLTSCCCPIWIAMIRKIYSQLMSHVPSSVSPMVACGRTIKHLHPDALTVFVGPCIAKKAEAREADIADAVDFVLTFQEMRDIFEAMGINPAEMEESERDHSSRAGRIYAKAGGVSEAVSQTLERISPDRDIKIRTQKADGVPACRAMINDLLAGKTNANFYEGMGCVGGCVGGPKAIIDKEQGRKHVDDYAAQATYPTPADNPYVIEILHRLGFESIESLLEDSKILTRH